jgi:hypothetical protein
VFWRYDAKTMTMEMVAVRDLKAGEEIVHTCEISRSVFYFFLLGSEVGWANMMLQISR